MKSRFPAFSPLGFVYFVPSVLILFLLPQNVYGVDVTLAWDPNSEQDLGGYTVFYREEDQTYDYSYPAWEAWLEELQNPDDPRCTIYNLHDSITYCFVARAFDIWGNEGGNSNEVCYQSSENLPTPAPSDDGGGGGGGCFIATASMDRHVSIHRNFRDTYLLHYSIGRILIGIYNEYSPPVSHFVEKCETLKTAVRIGLLPLVAVSYSVLCFGPVFTLSMLAFLLILPIFLVSSHRRKAQRGLTP
jgi:hypothetical protein